MQHIQATTETDSKHAQATPETEDKSYYFNTAFHLDLENVIEDMSNPADRPLDLRMAFPDAQEIASSWGGSSRSSSKAPSIPDNWDEDLTPEQQERHDELSNR